MEAFVIVKAKTASEAFSEGCWQLNGESDC